MELDLIKGKLEEEKARNASEEAALRQRTLEDFQLMERAFKREPELDAEVSKLSHENRQLRAANDQAKVAQDFAERELAAIKEQLSNMKGVFEVMEALKAKVATLTSDIVSADSAAADAREAQIRLQVGTL